MRAAYIGILTPGSTSRMRAERLKALTPGWKWDWIDTDVPMHASSRIWQSAAFRWNWGLAVSRVNDQVKRNAASLPLDLAWIDKAVFLTPSTIDRVRAVSRRMVHFTPDTAFHQNRSRHFEQTIAKFDLLATTKSFEMKEYQVRAGDRVKLVTQGYDLHVHQPLPSHAQRERAAVFIGLAERARKECVAVLLDKGVKVSVGGRGWKSFARRFSNSPFFTFLGEDLHGAAYANALSTHWVGLGLLSRRFPELHTTRTFEIPACGTILATERTEDTTRFFNEDEVVFFSDYVDLAVKLEGLLNEASPATLAELASSGARRVAADRRDYDSILASILDDERLGLSRDAR